MIALPRPWRPWALATVSLMILVQIVALSPSLIDVAQPDLTPENILEELGTEKTVAPGVPKQKVPDYAVDGFNFVSTHEGKKQWKIMSERAYFYQKENLIHNRKVTAYLYDDQDQTTVITGDEAQYYPSQRVLEMFGHVVTKFPDGFITRSDYMKYYPDRKRVEVPDRYRVTGEGTSEEDKDKDRMRFSSGGFQYETDKNLIYLPSQAQVVSISATNEETTIDSDFAYIHREIRRADFDMRPELPLSKRFVHIHQPKTYCQSRSAQLFYGDQSETSKTKPITSKPPAKSAGAKPALDSLTAYQDVLIRDLGEEASMKYATSGRAVFDSEHSLITLYELPQVYQDDDTVTGDVILLHRDTDIVEVEHSNAYSEGQQAPAPAPTEKPSQKPTGKKETP